MAKRGETRPWRVIYTWPSGVTGVMTFRTEDEAIFWADQQKKVVGPNGDRCEVRVGRRQA